MRGANIERASLSVMFSFAGCAGIGVVDSPDPLVK
jgi:hypothetical protein